MSSRPPDLLEGRLEAERLVGAEEAQHLVVTRPSGVLMNILPERLPEPCGEAKKELHRDVGSYQGSTSRSHGSFGQRMRRLFG